MSARAHPLGHCTCRKHVGRPWNRPEHWTAAEVEYLEIYFGTYTDAGLARHLGRSVLGIRLKAKRLGLRKRDAGLSARAFASLFGVDPTTVVDHWIARGWLKARRGWSVGAAARKARVWRITEVAAEHFIDEHGELIDLAKMPESLYRERAARHPWVSLAEVHRLTGRNHHAVALLIREGLIRGRRRGSHWYIPLADVGQIRHLSPDAIEESVFRRESVLEVRRARRKGVRRLVA